MVLLAAALAVYFGAYAAATLSEPFTTTLVYSYTSYNSVEADGLLAREEQVLPTQAGIVDVTRGEGEKVGAGQTVALVYRDSQAQEDQAQLQSLAMEIELLEYAAVQSGDVESAARLDEDILQSVVQLRASTALGDYSELEEQVLEVKSSVLKRGYTYGDGLTAADLTARIMQQVRQEPVPMAPRTAAPARPARCTPPAPMHKAPPAKPAARKRPAAGRTSPLLPISVMAACLALILGATLWFAPHRNLPSSSGTALDNSRAPTVTVSPSVKDEVEGNRKQDALPATESAPVLDDSVSSLLFSVPAEDSADSTTLHISDRKTIEELSALLVRTHPAQPVDAAQTPLCVLEESNADSTTTRVTVWRDGKDVIFASSADAQSYRVPGAAAEFCRLTGLPEN
mgnify:CR=1 FL=1